jgi:hypothetical protein
VVHFFRSTGTEHVLYNNQLLKEALMLNIPSFKKKPLPERIIDTMVVYSIITAVLIAETVGTIIDRRSAGGNNE